MTDSRRRPTDHAEFVAYATDAAPRTSSVLLVDDRPENLVALEAILDPLGLRLVRAASADEALRHVLQESFAVILLDVEMPGTGGIETARLIKGRTRSEHVPIIFLTALDQDRRRVTLGYESGAVDYLFKPLDPDLLRAKVAAFVELDRLRDALAEQQGRRFADLAVRESEERFRLVQRATNDVVWDWDLVNDTLHWNEQAQTVFRSRHRDVMTGVDWWEDRIHPDDRARVVAGVRAAIGEGAGAAWTAEYRFRLGDDTYATFLDRGYVAGDMGGRPTRMIGAMQDVTERARARDAAERARRDAEAASRLKSEFLATMSHEFRTPLNAILGYAQILDMGVLGPATPAQHAHLERLQASARHLLQLVDDLLDVAKVDANRMAVRRDPMLTGPAVAAAVTLVQPQATSRGVRLVDLGAGEVGVPYLGDEHRVRQVLVNLLSNAVKFTPSGRQVSVACGTADEPEPGVWRPDVADAATAGGRVPWAYVRVDDEGPGVPAELVDQLFEPFVQGNAALTREQGGTGLGLAISRRLARLMGGDLTLRSRAGSGATFTLWLPGTRADADARPAIEPGAPRPAPPLGMAPIDEPSGTPLDAAAYAVLHALSARLAAEAETIAERYVAALRADGRFPGVKELPAVQLRDHTTPFVGLLASQLMVIGETHGRAPELLGDGAQLQRVMAELHGAQRYRLGWAEADIERETPLLLGEIERVIRASLPATPPAGDTEAATAAARYATDVSRHVLERAARTAIRSYRFARSTDTV